MDEFGVTITGLDECFAELDALPSSLVKEGFAKAFIDSAVPMAQELAARTPVDTGLLASSIKTDIGINADGKGGYVDVGFTKDEAHIAYWMEYGFQHTGHKPDKKKGEMVTPKSVGFMRSASEASADAAVEAFSEALQAVIDAGDV